MERESIIRMDEINIRTILKDLIKNSPFIILAILIAIMGVQTYKNIVYVPEYTASTTLAVMAKGNAEGSAYSSLSTASSMAEVFSEVFQSEVVKEKVEEEIGKMPENTKIASELIPETNLLKLSVTTEDPQSAYRVLQAILGNYRNVSDYIFGNAVLEVIMDPEVPVAPSNTFETARLKKLGILGATALMAALIILFSILRNTVKTTKTAKRHLEGDCLAVLPFEHKNKTLKGKIRKTNKAVLLSNPVISFGYEEGCDRLASSMEYKTGAHNIVLVTSVAENEGKSTVAVNLAIALARRNKNVLLVDMDFAKPAIYKLMDDKSDKRHGLLEFMDGKVPLRDVVRYDKEKKIYTILNKKGLNDANKYLTAKFARVFLEAARKNFDYVILDSAPLSVGADTEYLQEYVDSSVLVVREDRVMISDLNDAVETLSESGNKFLGYVLNGFDKAGFGIIGRYGYGKYGKYGKYGNYGNYSNSGRFAGEDS